MADETEHTTPTLDEVFDGPRGQLEPGDLETQAAPAAEAAPPAADTPPAPEGAQPAPPAAAAEAAGTETPPAEARERNDWKAEAIREKAQREALEARLRDLEAKAAPPQPAAAQPPASATPPEQFRTPDPVTEPEEYARYQEAVRFNDRMNVSEMLLRSKHEDVDEVIAHFEEAAKANPALGAALRDQRHPWDWAYKQGLALKAQKEIGDPATYRDRLRAELRAEVEAELAAKTPATPPAPPALPPNLNGVRSAGARGADVFTGPTPLESIFPLN